MRNNLIILFLLILGMSCKTYAQSIVGGGGICYTNANPNTVPSLTNGFINKNNCTEVFDTVNNIHYGLNRLGVVGTDKWVILPKQSAITGTLNYLPKYASTGITPSQVFDNGTNVGINNANPIAKIDIYSTSTTQSAFQAANGNGAKLTVGDGGGASVYILGSQVWIRGTDGTPKFVFDGTSTTSYNDLNMVSKKILNLANGTTSTDAINLGQLTWANITGKPTALSQFTDDYYGLRYRGTLNTPTDDWNNYINTGIYLVQGASWGATLNSVGNTFVSAYTYGTLEVITNNGSVVSQTYKAHSTGDVYTRNKFNASDWTTWTKVLRILQDASGNQILGVNSLYFNNTNSGITSDGNSIYLKATGNTYLNTANTSYITNTGNGQFNGSVIKSPTASTGYLNLNVGNTVNSGYIDFMTPNGARAGYLGYAPNGGSVLFNSDNGAGFNFSGGRVDLATQKITGLGNATLATDAVNYGQTEARYAQYAINNNFSATQTISTTGDEPFILNKLSGTEWSYMAFKYAGVRRGYVGIDSNADLILAAEGTNKSIKLLPIGTGSVNVSGFKITNLANGTASTDAVNLSQLNAIGANISGTTNFIPKFVTANSIGNSRLNDDGTNLNLNSSITNATINFSGVAAKNKLRIANNTVSGSYNPLVTTDDIGLIYGDISDATTRGLVIAPHSGTLSGMRLDASGKVLINQSATNVINNELQVTGTTSSTNGFVSNGSLRQIYHDVFTYSSSANPETGTRIIEIPNGWTNNMAVYTIEGYDYTSTTGAWKVEIGGYNYSGDSTWNALSVQFYGNCPFSNVRLGFNAATGKNVIMLGAPTTSWYYPKFTVSLRATTAPINYTIGWTTTLVTVETPYTRIYTPQKVNNLVGVVRGANGVGANDFMTKSQLDALSTIYHPLENQRLSTTNSPIFPSLNLNGTDNSYRELLFRTNGSNRWDIYAIGTESGSNSGTDFNLSRYADNAAYLGSSLHIRRNTGFVGINNTAPTEQLTVGGNISAIGDVKIQGGNNLRLYRTDNLANHQIFYNGANDLTLLNGNGGSITFGSNLVSEFGRFAPNGNLLVGSAIDNGSKLQITGSINATSNIVSAANINGVNLLASSLSRTGLISNGTGFVDINAGNTTNSGYINFMRPNQQRSGYIGYATNTGANVLTAENGSWYEFTGASGVYFNAQLKAVSNATVPTDGLPLGQADGRYGQLATNNTWTGIQTINNAININSNNPLQFNSRNSWKTYQTTQNGDDIIGWNIDGNKLLLDEEFSIGLNGLGVYNNAGGTALVMTRTNTAIANTPIPNSTGFYVKFQVDNSSLGTSPAFGGFYPNIPSGSVIANRIYYQRFRALIPIGYSVTNASNALGTNAQDYWLSSQAGTGKWEEYVRVCKAGDSAPFSTGFHVYISGSPTPTVATPLIWYVASHTIKEVTNQTQTSAQIGNFPILKGNDGTVGTVGQIAINTGGAWNWANSPYALSSNISGTSNFIPKSNGSNGYIDSKLYQNNGALVLDATSPYLQLKNNGVNALILGTDDAITAGSASDVNLYAYGTNKLFLSVNTSKIITVDGTTTSKVGINTTTPTNTLDVNGSTRLRGLLEMPTNTDLTMNAYYSGGWKYRAAGYAADIFQNTGGDIQFYTAPTGLVDAAISYTNQLSLNQVGGASINKILTVGLQGGSDITYITGGSGLGSLIETRYADGTKNNIFSGNSNTYLTTTYGNTIIGTLTSIGGNKLDVKGTGGFYSGAVGAFAHLNVGRTGSEARIGVAANANDFLTGNVAGDANFYNVAGGRSFYGTAGNYDVLFVSNNSERMRINAAGNVGIGVAPITGTALTVNSTGINTTVMSLSGSTNAFTLKTKYYDPTAINVKTYRIGLDYNSGQGENGYVDFYRGGDGVTGFLKFGTSGVDRMTLDASGNLGLGVVNPLYKLHVDGTGAVFSSGGYNYATVSQVISSGDAIFGGGIITEGVTGGKIKKINTDISQFIGMQISDGITFHTNITGASGLVLDRTVNEVMRINNSANVLIGAISDNSLGKLQVTGNVYSTQGFFTTASTVGIAGDGTSLYLKAAANTYLNTANNAYVTNSGTIQGTYLSSTSGIRGVYIDNYLAGTGYVNLQRGTTRYGGFLEIYKPNGIRAGYIGFPDSTTGASSIQYSAENITSGNTAHNFVGGNISVGSSRIINGSAAINPTDFVIKSQLDATVTGAISGTVNYLPKFLTANSIGGSLAYEHNNNGISLNGTRATPNYIYGKGNADDASLKLRSGSTVGYYSEISIDGWDGTGTASNINFRTAGVDQMRLHNTGNLSLGTINQLGKFTIVKNSTYNSEGTNGIYIQSGNAATEVGMLLGTDKTNNIAYIQSLEPTTSYGSKKLVLNPNGGNIGFGTPLANANFHFVGTELRTGGVVNAYTSFYNQTNRSGYIQANNGSDFRIASDTDPMTFYVGATERARLNSFGQFAINLNNPTATFSVAGTMEFSPTSAKTDRWATYTGGAGLIYSGTTTATDIGFITNGGEKLRLLQNGTIKAFGGAYQTQFDTERNIYRDVMFYSGNSGTPYTGAFVIETPLIGNAMVSITIKGYDYSSRGSWSATVSGYTYSPLATSSWLNYKGEVEGVAPFKTMTLGYSTVTNKYVIILGGIADSWSYPKIEVSELIVGFNNGHNVYSTGWSGSFVTALTNYGDLRAVNLQKQMNGYGVGTYQSTPTKFLGVDANGGVVETPYITSNISGTANYIPMFTSANVIGNSGVYQSNPNLWGFGTASPVGIYGATVNVKSSTGGSIALNGTTVSGYVSMSDGLGMGVLGTSSNHPLQIITNGIERARFEASGNLGIGQVANTSTLAKLYVNGGIQTGTIFSNASSVTDAVTLTGTSSVYVPSYGIAWGSTTSSTPEMYLSGYNGINFVIGSVIKAQITNTGNIITNFGGGEQRNVTIGANPAYNTITGGIYSNMLNYTKYDWYSSAWYVGSYRSSSSVLGDFGINNGTTDVMRIQSNGSVGIGISTPTERLSVGGYILSKGKDATTKQGRFIQQRYDGSEMFAMGIDPTLDNGNIEFRSSNGNPFIWTSGGTGATTLATLSNAGQLTTTSYTQSTYFNGLVGISTLAGLKVANNSGENNIHIGEGNGATGNRYAYVDFIGDATYTDYGLRVIRGNTGANTYSQIVHRGTGALELNTSEAAPINFVTNATIRAVIQANGVTQFNSAITQKSGTGVAKSNYVYSFDDGTASKTGVLVFELPVGWNSTMATYVIEGFNYNGTTQGSWRVEISGYNYNSGTPATCSWTSFSAQTYGNVPFSNVKLGYNAATSKNVIMLGAVGTVWAYPKLTVSVTTSHTYTDYMNTGWSSSWVTSEAAYTFLQTVTPSQTFLGTTTLNGGLVANSLDIKSQGYGLFYNSDNTNYSGIRNTGVTGASNSNLDFFVGGNTVSRITPAGWVGIGTLSPISRLHVTSSTSVPTYATIGNNANGILMGVAADGTNQIINYAGKGLVFGGNFNTTQTEQMRLDGTGNLGIGIATPTQKLDINGNIALNGTLFATPTAFGYGSGAYKVLMLGSTNTPTTISLGVDPIANTNPSFTGNGGELLVRNAFTFITPNSSNNGYLPVLSFNNSNVGLSTATPQRKLDISNGGVYIRQTIGSNDVSANQHNTQFEIRMATGEKSMSLGVYDDGRGVIQVKEAGVGYNNLLLNPVNGLVGIGVANPTQKLHVGTGVIWVNRPTTKVDNASANEFTGKIEINYPSFSAGVANYIGYKWIDAINYRIQGEYDGSAGLGGTSPNIQFGNTNNTFLHIQNNGATAGNIGIGTSTPDSKLDVIGTSSLTRFRVGYNGTGQNYLDGSQFIIRTSGGSQIADFNATNIIFSFPIAMSSQKIIGLANGTASTDAVNKSQLDAISTQAGNWGQLDGHGTFIDYNNISRIGGSFVQGSPAINAPTWIGSSGSQGYQQISALGSNYDWAGSTTGSYAQQTVIGRNSTTPYFGVRWKEGGVWGSWTKIWAGKADQLTTSKNINGSAFDGTIDILTTEYLHSLRDFTNGTLITTNIDYSANDGDAFLLEIKGNSYGNVRPLDLKIQGYIYSGTIINIGGVSNGQGISGMVAINSGGFLCFWFPNQGYWQGYAVNCMAVTGAGRNINRTTSITNVVKPAGATKEVALSAGIVQSLHSVNYSTNIDLSTLSVGTLADARLSANVALKNINNNFSATQTITGSGDTPLNLNKPSGTEWNYAQFNYAGTRRAYFGIESGANFIIGVDGVNKGIILATNGTGITNMTGGANVGGALGVSGTLTSTGTIIGLGVVQSTVTSDEGGSLSIFNPSKVGGIARDWRIFNMTGAYGNALVFWSYNQSGAGSQGRTLEIRDDGNIVATRGNFQAPSLVSTIVTGTAPLTVASTTLVTNLNAQFLNGLPSSSFLTSVSIGNFANYLPKNTGNGTQGQSLVFDNGSGVGINTTNIKAAVNFKGVAGNALTSGSTVLAVAMFETSTNSVLLTGGQSAAPYGNWLQSTDKTDLSVKYPLQLQPIGGNVILGGYADTGDKFQVNGTTYHSGKVSVGGAINTGFDLTVNGNALISTNLSVNSLISTNTLTIAAPVAESVFNPSTQVMVYGAGGNIKTALTTDLSLTKSISQGSISNALANGTTFTASMEGLTSVSHSFTITMTNATQNSSNFVSTGVKGGQTYSLRINVAAGVTHDFVFDATFKKSDGSNLGTLTLTTASKKMYIFRSEGNNFYLLD